MKAGPHMKTGSPGLQWSQSLFSGDEGPVGAVV